MNQAAVVLSPSDAIIELGHEVAAVLSQVQGPRQSFRHAGVAQAVAASDWGLERAPN